MGLTSRIAAERDSWDWQLGFASGMPLGTGSWDWQLGQVANTGSWDWHLGLKVGTGSQNWQRTDNLCCQMGLTVGTFSGD